MTTELRPEELYRRCDPSTVPFETTAEHDEHEQAFEIVGQDRAVEATRFALGMRHDGYNVFALGPEGVGRETVIRQLLAQEAPRQPTPPDRIYVHDFAQPRHPKALTLPSGTATQLRDHLQRAIAELRHALPAAFDSEEFRTRKHRLVLAFERRQEAAFEAVQRRARGRHIGMVRTDEGVTIGALRGDQLLESAELEKLPEAERATLDEAMHQVGDELAAMFHDFQEWETAHARALATLDRELAEATARAGFDRLRTTYQELPTVLAQLAAYEHDIADHVEWFLPTDDAEPDEIRHALHPHDDDRAELRRYQITVMADHGKASGAPIVAEEHPTYANLIGRVEHESDLGALVTDVTLVRPGALHRANGGYLLLDANKLLHEPFVWAALKRALRTREIRIEPPDQTLGQPSTTTLEPEPMQLDIKVILFGDRALFYMLTALDPELEDLFKVMADFETTIEHSPDATAQYARLIATLAQRDSLRPFDRLAIARIIEHAARLAGDAHKLSLHLRSLGDLLREASDHARRSDRAIATAGDVDAAIASQRRRAGRLRETMLEAIRRRTLLIDTRGEAVGQINGLSLVELGHHTFGYPTRITARARLGQGEVIDIEREVELGGPVHSKGVMILAGLLGARYAQHMPLALSAQIVFEQSYGGVEGDSASLAELCVLLSAIGDVPLRQAFAITGSVNQHGALQPVGGVNEKIEGFFDACREQGLTGEQGVIIPHANVQHLVLRPDVVAAVADGTFHVHAVLDVDEALALLTSRPAERVHAMVEARLRGFSEDTRRFLTIEKWHRHAG